MRIEIVEEFEAGFDSDAAMTQGEISLSCSNLRKQYLNLNLKVSNRKRV
jgi:hypothetical protein